MIEVRSSTGEVHRGKSPQSIARRLYGHHAWVAVGSTVNLGINGYVEATVLKRIPGDRASAVMATWLLDPAALDAAAAAVPAEEV